MIGGPRARDARGVGLAIQGVDNDIEGRLCSPPAAAAALARAIDRAHRQRRKSGGLLCAVALFGADALEFSPMLSLGLFAALSRLFFPSRHALQGQQVSNARRGYPRFTGVLGDELEIARSTLEQKSGMMSVDQLA